MYGFIVYYEKDGCLKYDTVLTSERLEDCTAGSLFMAVNAWSIGKHGITPLYLTYVPGVQSAGMLSIIADKINGQNKRA